MFVPKYYLFSAFTIPPQNLYILKGKRNTYFDFQNVGVIMKTNFVLIPSIYTNLYRI